jgi:hypothetical protein
MKRAMTPLMNGSRHDDHCPEGTVANHLRHAMFVGPSTLSTRANCRVSWHDIFRRMEGKIRLRSLVIHSLSVFGATQNHSLYEDYASNANYRLFSRVRQIEVARSLLNETRPEILSEPE